jgi:DNA invertase Pin-like site-specific DNA recombinase
VKNIRVCLWVRVSTGSQDESSQLRELRAYAASMGYTIVKVIRLHDVSASKGEQEDAMNEVIADVQALKYEVLLVDDSSRLDRRDNVHARDYFRAAVGLAGGAIESRTEPLFGKVDLAGQMITLLAAQGNADYSVKLKKMVDRGMTDVAAAKAFHGKRPWGWVSEGPDKGVKHLVCQKPDDIKEMYRRAIALQSCADIGRAFELYSETVNSIIRNEANMGRRKCSHTFSDGTKAEWIHQCEAVVDEDTWLLANAALDAKKRQPSTLGRKPKHLLSGALTCAECGGVMHAKVQERYPGVVYSYLRCGGLRATANAKGCGNTLKLDVATAAVELFLAKSSAVGVMEKTIKPGNRLAITAERKKLDESAEALKAMPGSVRAAAMVAIDAEYARLDAIRIVEDEEALTRVGSLGEVWETGDKRRLLDSLDLVIDRQARVDIEESFPSPASGYVVLSTGLILDMG